LIFLEAIISRERLIEFLEINHAKFVSPKTVSLRD